MNQDHSDKPLEKRIEFSKSFIDEIEFLKKESDIKRDLYAIDFLECLLRDQNVGTK